MFLRNTVKHSEDKNEPLSQDQHRDILLSFSAKRLKSSICLTVLLLIHGVGKLLCIKLKSPLQKMCDTCSGRNLVISFIYSSRSRPMY